MWAKQRGHLQKPFEASCILKASRGDEITLPETSNKGLDDRMFKNVLLPPYPFMGTLLQAQTRARVQRNRELDDCCRGGPEPGTHYHHSSCHGLA